MTRRGAVDAYLRRQDTRPARALRRLSPATGPSYTASAAKRGLDLALVLPIAIGVVAVVLVLIAVNRALSPRRSALFLQDRVGRSGGSLRVIKLRSMVRRQQELATVTVCTAFGRFIRRYYLDELPQLLQVLSGRLSLVGIRVLPRDVYDGLARSWSPERFARWRAMYSAAPLGLTGAHQVFRGVGKHDAHRYHRDMFYAAHAGLGFDLYLLWRTLGTGDHEHDRVPGVQTARRSRVQRPAAMTARIATKT